MHIVKVRDNLNYECKTEVLAIRLSVKEKRKIIQHAQNSGLNVSDFIRQRLCYDAPDLMQQITNNYVKSLEIKGLDRGISI
ncbi:MAG: hypothetical protein PUP93_13780 [Rhizonema sp. NSF051]|nr:hypothetical protein [Rhizonema sp. NSF051]